MRQNFLSLSLLTLLVLASTACSVGRSESSATVGNGNSHSAINAATSLRLRQEASPLFFLDDKVGWVVSNGRIYGTTDGGNRWQLLHRISSASATVAVLFANQNDGWATVNDWSGKHDHLVLKSDDGGRTWRQLVNLQSPIYRIDFVDDRLGFVRERWELIHRTTDGGQTWEELNLPDQPENSYAFQGLQYFFFLTSDEGWGYGSAIWRTSDRGQTWNVVVSLDKTKGVLDSSCFVDTTHGWIVGEHRQIWHMTDGKTWQLVKDIPPAQGPPQEIGNELPHHLYSVTFVNQMEGWVAADDKTVLHSRDGGVTWEVMARFSVRILALRFVSGTEGWALDDDGHLLHTVDAGRTWNTQVLPE